MKISKMQSEGRRHLLLSGEEASLDSPGGGGPHYARAKGKKGVITRTRGTDLLFLLLERSSRRLSRGRGGGSGFVPELHGRKRKARKRVYFSKFIEAGPVQINLGSLELSAQFNRPNSHRKPRFSHLSFLLLLLFPLEKKML